MEHEAKHAERTMENDSPQIRVLYSFPHKLGAGRICYTAWQQVNGVAAAGAYTSVFPGVVHRPLVHPNANANSTLAFGRFRIPYRLLGTLRACTLHDHIVARRLRKMAGKIDIVHTWPLGALETLRTAAGMGIPTVLERPNAHTRFAYEVVEEESRRLGVSLPPGHEHSFQADVLAREEAEYDMADHLLCPSEFVVKTFLDQGVPKAKLARHQYGYDPGVYFPAPSRADCGRGLTMLFVGVCAVRKGLHFALDAWLKSPAHVEGKFLIAGQFLPAYADRLADKLAHPSIQVLGHRNDIPELMRQADVFVLPSIEEGYPLVCADAIGSGCVPLVSEACSEFCEHMTSGLVHRIGDVDALTRHIGALHEDRSLLYRLRAGVLKTAPNLTWNAAGKRLFDVYRTLIHQYQSNRFALV